MLGKSATARITRIISAASSGSRRSRSSTKTTIGLDRRCNAPTTAAFVAKSDLPVSRAARASPPLARASPTTSKWNSHQRSETGDGSCALCDASPVGPDLFGEANCVDTDLCELALGLPFCYFDGVREAVHKLSYSRIAITHKPWLKSHCANYWIVCVEVVGHKSKYARLSGAPRAFNSDD